jgi:hypothetical protein
LHDQSSPNPPRPHAFTAGAAGFLTFSQAGFCRKSNIDRKQRACLAIYFFGDKLSRSTGGIPRGPLDEKTIVLEIKPVLAGMIYV